MKHIHKILLVVMAASLFWACEEQNTDILVGGDGSADLSGRQYANIDPPTSVPFFFQGTSEVIIPLAKFESSGSTIASVEVSKTLTRAGESSATVTFDVTGDAVNQSLSDLFADVPVGGVVMTEDSLAPGDFWTFSYKINLSGNSPTSDNVLDIAIDTHVPFSCVSKIPTEGTWTGETQNGSFGIYSSNPEVTITDNGSGNYTLSDISGGFYAAFGFNRDQPGNINDLCNIITVTSAPDAQFSVGNTGSVPGSWDSGTEVLTVTWYDNLNDIDEATVHTRN